MEKSKLNNEKAQFEIKNSETYTYTNPKKNYNNEFKKLLQDSILIQFMNIEYQKKLKSQETQSEIPNSILSKSSNSIITQQSKNYPNIQKQEIYNESTIIKFETFANNKVSQLNITFAANDDNTLTKEIDDPNLNNLLLSTLCLLYTSPSPRDDR